MASLIKNIYQLFCKIKFTNPEKNDIIILHHNSNWLKKFVLRDIKSTILADDQLGRVYFITPSLFFKTIFKLHLISWPIKKNTWSVKSCRWLLKSFLHQIYRVYLLACIEQIQAKLVITYIDNSPIAQYLSRVDLKRTYFFVQNGARTLACVRDTLPISPHPGSIISMTNFFCFGQRDVDLFIRYGHQIDNYFPIGSLGMGCYKIHGQSNTTIDFDLCLISQWDKSFLNNNLLENPVDKPSYRTGIGISGVNFLLSKFVKETGLSLVICPRHENNDEEIAYLRGIFGDKAYISEPNYKNFAAYQIIDRSELIIALNSTLLLEAFSSGNKVLWCNVPKDEHYKMPEAGISYFEGSDYVAFKEQVLMLLKMPRHEYQDATLEKAHYISNYDYKNPPHEIIRAAVLSVLNKPVNKKIYE